MDAGAASVMCYQVSVVLLLLSRGYGSERDENRLMILDRV